MTIHSLLTPDNCTVCKIDHQPQMLFGVANFDRQSVINNTVALAKSAKLFNVPVILSTVETKSYSGYIWILTYLTTGFQNFPLAYPLSFDSGCLP